MFKLNCHHYYKIAECTLLLLGLPNGNVDSEGFEDSEDGGVAFINIESENEKLSKDTLGKCRPIVAEELVSILVEV